MNNKISLKISTSEASEILNVSSATVLNWVKTGYLCRDKFDNKLFSTIDVLELKKKIESGEIYKLGSRANKKISKVQFLPFESIKNDEDIPKIIGIISDVKKFNLNIEETLFVLAINLLIQEEIIKKNVIKNDFYFINDNFRDEVRNWLSVLNPDNLAKELVYNIDIGDFNEDILGILYQYFLSEGEKNKKGSYYTPESIVKKLVKSNLDRLSISSHIGKNNFKILDPCCGTGKFLLGISDYFANIESDNGNWNFDPKTIWGFDNDKIAVRIARINLMLKFRDIKNFSPNIYHLDYLTDKFNFTRRVRFDSIITNPPWGVKFSKEEKKELSLKFPEIKSSESFSYFLAKSINMLKEDGFLSFLLPESLLNIKTHKDIRKFILENSRILSINKYGKLFKGVFSDVIDFELKKSSDATKNNSAEIFLEYVDKKQDIRNKIKQERFYTNQDNIFDVNISLDDEIIINKIYCRKHKTLESNANWALGIVTGNNLKYISNTKKNKNYMRVISGREISRYNLNSNFSKFLNVDEIKNFQQVASMAIYSSKEKLIYKFISSKLIFAYDNNSLLTLNSANILIPKIKNISIKTILALLNSTLYQYLFNKKFNSFKVLRGDLEKLPIPNINKDMQKNIEKFVDILLQPNNFEEYRTEIYDELDSLIYKIFKLTKKEIEIIKS